LREAALKISLYRLSSLAAILIAPKRHLALGRNLSTTLSSAGLTMQNKSNSTSLNPAANPNDPLITIGYATDIEGNFDYWSRYIELSKILNRLPTGELELHDKCHFVYGGDVVDRGPGDLRVLSDLVGLKKSYPERVHFIMGNRDINKMRIPAELHAASLRFPSKVYWIKSDLAEPNSSENDTVADRLKWVRIILCIM
jgi:Calcineurin-like phosphoesterase